MDDWKQGTVFMRHTDKDGGGYIESHACWNTDKFIAAQREAAQKAGGSVGAVTQAEYAASKRK